MARHLHIHLHTRDSGEWTEGDHPRASNGEFGSGNAAGTTAGRVSLKGDELGKYGSMKDLRQKAIQYADRFIGKKYKNRATGHEILITKTGVKHTVASGGDELIRTVPAIPALLESATMIGSVPDKRGDPNILAVETYSAPIVIAGKARKAVIVVKRYQDGRRFYDQGLVE